MAKKRSFRLNIMAFAAVLLGLTFLSVVGSRLLPQAKAYCANSDSCINNLSGAYEPTKEGVFMGQKVSAPAEDQTTSSTAVLGEQTGADKHIYVDLTHQTLYAYEGGQLVYSFPVSTGKWALTPTGDFNIWIKLRYTLMTGGNPAIGTYYYLPNVPYTMYFYNSDHPKTQGYGIHGTYWHHNFGHPMSHGCINMKNEDVAQLYNWASPPSTSSVTYASATDPGTPITIYGVTPKE